jgi:TldD protein
MSLSRRELLKVGAAGTAMLSMPAWLAACGPKQPVAALQGVDDPFLAWFGVDEAMLRTVLAELASRGADDADLYFQHARSTSVTFEDGIVSRASTSIDQGVGLRVVVGDQVGYAFTEELTLESMLAAARTASAIATGAAVPPAAAFARPARASFYEVPVAWSDVGIDRRLPLVQKAAGMARTKDGRVEKVSASWSDGDERVLIATLDGRIITDRRPQSRLWVNVTARDGDVVQANSANLAGRRGLDWYDDERLNTVAQQAIDRTLVLFDARRPPAGEFPVVLAAGASGILLHEAIGHGMEADFNRKNTSIYSTMIGQKVGPDFVTVIDDGTIPGERGALNVDDEGTPCERTVLVENGVLKSYLHDKISAKHYGRTASTGSGRRESFRHMPLPRMRCTTMENGPHDREEIIRSVKRGIIAETFTNGQVQIGAGDFTFYIKNGWMIEDGVATYPIKDVNIIGNGPEALRNVTMAAGDSALDTGGWTCGKDGQSVPVSQGLPTVLVSKLAVGGANG